MNKRLAAAVGTAALATSVLGVAAAPAQAASSPQPCATYPAGQTWAFSTLPTRITIRKGSNVEIYGSLTRGDKHEGCNGYLVTLQYTAIPGRVFATARTDERGLAQLTAVNVISSRSYFLVGYFAGGKHRSANVGQIFVRGS